MTRAEILDKAKECVCGQRELDYGTPEDNFRTIANLWTAYKLVNFTPQDVAMMMALLKIARIKSGTGTDDSFVDLAGYAACGGEIASNGKRTTVVCPPCDEPEKIIDNVIDFTFSDRIDADKFIAAMLDILERCKYLYVRDVYDLASRDIPQDLADYATELGWKSLHGIRVYNGADGCHVALPEFKNTYLACEE